MTLLLCGLFSPLDANSQQSQSTRPFIIFVQSYNGVVDQEILLTCTGTELTTHPASAAVRESQRDVTTSFRFSFSKRDIHEYSVVEDLNTPFVPLPSPKPLDVWVFQQDDSLEVFQRNTRYEARNNPLLPPSPGVSEHTASVSVTENMLSVSQFSQEFGSTRQFDVSINRIDGKFFSVRQVNIARSQGRSDFSVTRTSGSCTRLYERRI
jgi:hypothetical protein